MSLPFYKPPQQKTNQYQFAKKDIAKIPVVQQRFEQKPTPTTTTCSDSDLQVTEGGLANQAGIKLGDTVVNIHGANTRDMSLADAHQRIQEAGEDLQLTVKNFEEDDESNHDGHEEHVIDLGARRKVQQEDRSNWIQPEEKKVWHPIVWQQAPPPIPPEMIGKDAPHKRIINNIYRFFREHDANHDFKQKHIEDMLLALPTISKQKP